MPAAARSKTNISSLPFRQSFQRTQKQSYILTKETPAFERVGLLSKLPRGAALEVIGDGFSDRTVTVVSNGISYVVFLQDLEDSQLASPQPDLHR